MPEYVIALYFGAPDDEHAHRKAEHIADLTAVEHGTRNPVVTPVDGELRDQIARALKERLPSDIPWENVLTFDAFRECRERYFCEADTALAVVMPELERLRAELAGMRELFEAANELAGARTDERDAEHQRAEQVEDLLRIAHDTSNKSEAERARTVERAEEAEDRLRAATNAYARLQAQADDAEAARDRWRKRAEEAEAAIKRVRELAKQWAGLAPADDWGDTVGDTAMADAGRLFLAALNAPSTPESPAGGSWADHLAAASLDAARAKFGPNFGTEPQEDT